MNLTDQPDDMFDYAQKIFCHNFTWTFLLVDGLIFCLVTILSTSPNGLIGCPRIVSKETFSTLIPNKTSGWTNI